MASAIKRDEVVNLRLDASMKKRLDALGVTVGVPGSTLAAIAVGQYVTHQEHALGLVAKVADGFMGLINDALTGNAPLPPAVLEQIKLFANPKQPAPSPESPSADRSHTVRRDAAPESIKAEITAGAKANSEAAELPREAPARGTESGYRSSALDQQPVEDKKRSSEGHEGRI